MSVFTSVERAEPDNTHEIMRLLVNTAEWLLSKGSTQWNALLRGEDSHNTPEAVNRGEVYIFRDDGKAAGMVILLPEPNAWDRDLWGERTDERPAIYVHRLAINRNYSGRGAGRQMMQWIETAVPALGRDVIRLDCLANNSVLNSFYSGLGYDLIGNASNSYGAFNKFEKVISS
ncbi:GNAT family N-acetyltransferase [Cohnella endophytica]|uniref:GNAT family N-acetyltransferase n=1 Tax=Cohnella endophytica TaxID=2419778 RepID=A0A494Y5T4_9BACL|nr:GNAT family N-acetyltransferase [Cohnella endophytica]RKP58040.1 GNAT family N-acetyltransferase [Cohnella endophytica]